MKVVFLEDIAGTAKIGDIKEVKAGFARNYLLPRRLAMPASPSVIKSAEQRAVRETRLQDLRDTDARAVAGRLEGIVLSFTAKAGSTGKLFGSVGTADIATKVGETLGNEFDRHNVLLGEPIKDLGDYPVVVKLTKNVTATITVTVVGEDGTTAADIRAKSGGTPRAEAPEMDAASDEDVDTESTADVADEEITADDEA